LFVFALFNLQGTSIVRFAANFDMIAHQEAFVKSYFQLFSNSFLWPTAADSAEVLAYTTKRYRKCQALFLIFYDFFSGSIPCVFIGFQLPNIGRFSLFFRYFCAFRTTSLRLPTFIQRIEPFIPRFDPYHSFSQN
jgi:hypothetical protein